MVELTLRKAIEKYIKAVHASLVKRGNNTETVAVSYGPRWAKIQANQKTFRGSRAMFFVDMKKGNTYGFLHEAESWARPRRWHFTNIFAVSKKK